MHVVVGHRGEQRGDGFFPGRGEPAFRIPAGRGGFQPQLAAGSLLAADPAALGQAVDESYGPGVGQVQYPAQVIDAETGVGDDRHQGGGRAAAEAGGLFGCGPDGVSDRDRPRGQDVAVTPPRLADMHDS